MNMNTTMTAAILAFVALATGCDNNRSGDIRATRFGDLSHLFDVRTVPGMARASACGQVEPEVAGPLRRRPYLQQMTARSVRVVWTADGRTSDGTVVVRGENGVVATSSEAVRDLSASPPRGAIQWSAAVGGLQPDTPYCYELRAGGVSLLHAGFRTPPVAGAGKPVRFVAFGDSGNGSSDQRAVAQQMGKVPLDFMLHLGDIAYEAGTRAQLEAYFFDMYADLLQGIPVFPASGNHEYETEDARPFREAFTLPENGGPDGVERWYSYDWGDVHLVALDSERVGPVQADWLDADLTANRLPWVIIYLHRPPFTSGEHGSDGNVRQYFVPLFVRHHVPLVLSGHDHDYERSTPQDGVTYVVSGGGGRGTRDLGRSSFTAFSEAVCHFLLVSVEGDQLVLHAIDGTGQEFDGLVLTLSPAR
jgi:hypothetical protein